MADEPSVSIIVLNWETWQDTLHCLAALQRLDYPNYHVLVVDNGSTNGSEARIRDAFPTVELIQTGANLGYAGGNNWGIRHALRRGTDFVLIVNPDTIVAPHALGALVDTMVSRADVAGMGPVVRRADNPAMLWSTGVIINWQHGWIVMDTTPLDETPFRISAAVAGCCILLRADALRHVGLFDPRYFLYHEETDLCQRLIEAGYTVGVCAGAEAIHRPGSSAGERSPRQTYYATRNLFLFFSRHLALHNRRPRRVLRGLYRQYLLEEDTLAGLPRRDPVAIARLCACLDYTLGRFGRSRRYTEG